MSSNFRQHFVPRFYLNHFCNQQKQIYCYDKFNKKKFQTTTKEIAVKKLFYDLETDILSQIEDKTQSLNDPEITKTLNAFNSKVVERSFSKIESNILKPIHDKLLKVKNVNKLNHRDKEEMHLFLAIQSVRTLEFRMDIKKAYEDLLMEMARDHFNKPFEGLKVEVPELRAKLMHYQHLISDDFLQFSPIFGLRNWIILINKTKVPLWASDNPVSLSNEFNYLGNKGILSKGVEIRMPLSNDLLLYSYDIDTSIPRCNRDCLTIDDVMRSNFSQVASSTRFIYSPTDNFDEADNFLVKWPEYRDPLRARSKIVSTQDKYEFFQL